jgi:citrate lyase beta subunit
MNFSVKSIEQSPALFGAKAEAISRLAVLASECGPDEKTSVHPAAVSLAESIVRALPDGISLPEFSAAPDGSISLDWIESRHRLFSLSVGVNHRVAFAWLDGTNRGHGVESFDGQQIPKRVLDGITAIVKNGNPSFRPV